MFRALEPWHLIILVLVVVLLFGGRRLPDAARGLGRSLRIFKSEVKQMQEDDPRPAAKRPTDPIEGPIEGPYEGRVVEEPRRASTPGEPRDL
ncbi:MAG TPA: Sec-independent protein translocase subunit TatA [Kineosporiaceae bacterium]|jgi:sec-independent protein translocase protein TatA|nr:Sec-independent protein translocase subunit TatA [Kineosporiaceae bacterium]